MKLPPKKTLKRIEHFGTARFLTFSCYRRLKLFSNDRIKDRFIEHLTSVSDCKQMEIFAWVVMPDHVHLIVNTNESVSIANYLLALKRPFALEVLNRWRELNAKILPKLRDINGKHHFWQAGGGYDRNVFGDELVEKIRYCHKNPIERGLCDSATDWKWSSAGRYSGSLDAVGPVVDFAQLPLSSIELI